MGFAHGKLTKFSLDNAAGALQDLSAYMRNISFGSTIETHDTTTFGDSYRDFIPGLKGADDITLECIYDPTVEAHLAGLDGLAASSTYEYGPDGSTTGKLKISGECFLTDLSVSSPVGDVATISVTLKKSGAVTRGTY